MIKNEEMKNLIKAYGELPQCSSMGGYGFVYLDNNNDCLCPSCANKLKDDEITEIVNVFIHWEGDDMTCDNCGNNLPSEYGIPQEEE